MGKKLNAVQLMILEEISKLTKDDKNVNIYKEMFLKQTDQEFKEFMEYLKDGNILNIIVDSDISKNKISVKNNFAIAKRLGKPMFQHFITKGMDGLPNTLSPHKYLNMIMPIKRTKHTSAKGVSVAEDSTHTDVITGQPIGVSKASNISGAEASLLDSMGLKHSLQEFMIDRADVKNFTLLNNAMKQYGHIPQELLDKYGSKTQTTVALWVYLRGMHLDLNI